MVFSPEYVFFICWYFVAHLVHACYQVGTCWSFKCQQTFKLQYATFGTFLIQWDILLYEMTDQLQKYITGNLYLVYTWCHVRACWSFKRQVNCRHVATQPCPSPKPILDTFATSSLSPESEFTHVTVWSSPSSKTCVTLSNRSKISVTLIAVLSSPSCNRFPLQKPRGPKFGALSAQSPPVHPFCALAAVLTSPSGATPSAFPIRFKLGAQESQLSPAHPRWHIIMTWVSLCRIYCPGFLARKIGSCKVSRTCC